MSSANDILRLQSRICDLSSVIEDFDSEMTSDRKAQVKRIDFLIASLTESTRLLTLKKERLIEEEAVQEVIVNREGKLLDMNILGTAIYCIRTFWNSLNEDETSGLSIAQGFLNIRFLKGRAQSIMNILDKFNHPHVYERKPKITECTKKILSDLFSLDKTDTTLALLELKSVIQHAEHFIRANYKDSSSGDELLVSIIISNFFKHEDFCQSAR